MPGRLVGLRESMIRARRSVRASSRIRPEMVNSPEGARTRPQMGGALTISLVVTGIVLGVNASTGLILARTFVPADRGALAAIMIGPFLIVGVGQLGITDALTVYAASGGDLGLAEGTIIPFAVVYGAVLTVIVATVGVMLNLSHGHESAFILSLVYVAPSLWTHWLAYYANGRGDVLHLNLIWLVNVALTLAGFLVLLALNDLTVFSAVAVYVVGTLVVAVWATAYFLGHRQPVRSFSSAAIRTWLRFGARSNVSGAADVVNQYVDQLVIAAVLPTRELGLYAVAVSLTSVTGLVGTAMGYAVLPAVAEAESAGDQRQRTKRALLVAVILASFATGLLFLLAPWAIRTLFGAPYEPAGHIARILLIGTGFLSINSVMMAALKGMGRPQDAGIAQLIGCAITIALLIVLVPSRGIEGAAITSAVAYGSVTVVLMLLLRRAETVAAAAEVSFEGRER
jgi:O-antigen/teichoic acid export membrane protein